jgi:hypothetical protein
MKTFCFLKFMSLTCRWPKIKVQGVTIVIQGAFA